MKATKRYVLDSLVHQVHGYGATTFLRLGSLLSREITCMVGFDHKATKSEEVRLVSSLYPTKNN